MRYDAMKESIIVGKPAIYCSMRINRDTVPKGMYQYEV